MHTVPIEGEEDHGIGTDCDFPLTVQYRDMPVVDEAAEVSERLTLALPRSKSLKWSGNTPSASLSGRSPDRG